LLSSGSSANGFAWADTVLGFEDDSMVAMYWSSRAPERAASAVVDQCSKMRATRHRDF
jgi:hypothetical protein